MPSPFICTSQSRDVSLNIISANAMARLIKKQNSFTQYFLAILKIESDFISLNAMETKDDSNPDKEINSIKTDFDNVFT